MIVWGGCPPGGGLGYDDGAMYNPESHQRNVLADAPKDGRFRHITLWTGTEMIVWGGQRTSGSSLSDGAAFRPDGQAQDFVGGRD
jgi:hypothetical protein